MRYNVNRMQKYKCLVNNNSKQVQESPQMQATQNYIQMAQEINNMGVYNKMYEQFNNFETLQYIFGSECEKSQQLLFVATQILSKKLKNNELILSSDEAEPLHQMADSTQSKKYILFNISTKLYSFVQNSSQFGLSDYLVRSCINTISLCMNATINSSSNFEKTFMNYFKLLIPEFTPNETFIKPSSDSALCIIQASKDPLGINNKYTVEVLESLLDYIKNSTYFQNYYYFRRSLYAFRNHYLAYLLNYSIYCLKSVFKYTLNAPANSSMSIININQAMRVPLKLFQDIVMYPFSLNMHEMEIEDQIHQNISGLQSQIYFPSYFRNVLCDTELLMDLISYFSRLNVESSDFSSVREDLYSLIRILGRILSTSEYIFVGEQEKKAFKIISVEFITRILRQNKYFDSYMIICISKINIKFMSIENQDQIFEGKRQYFQALMKFLCTGIATSNGKIEDGDKHPFRQLFEVLTAFVNISANTPLDVQSKNCAQEALNILLKTRLANNEDNNRLMKEFGKNNNQEIDCFAEIFARVPEIFKINLAANLTTLYQLNLELLSQSSLTFWLHLAALLLPQHDTSIEQTQLILKFLEKAISVYSIGSLHYIQTLIEQVLYEVKDGVSTTYLWKFIQESRLITFETFLETIISYAMRILTVPNYTLIQNCLELFKAMFSKLCKYRHKSFAKYFAFIEQVCREIDSTMLVHNDYMKLRIGFFSIISIIWINEGQVSFVYKIFESIRSKLNTHNDLQHFNRYMIDVTGLLEPVESSEIFKILLELVIVDLQDMFSKIMPDEATTSRAFSDQTFLRNFMRFVLTIINDYGYRLSYDVHTELPLKIQEMFRPYLLMALKFDYPRKTIEVWLKFLKLNPLSKPLPLSKTLKEKNSPHYKSLLRDYFQNLHRLSSLEQFYEMYGYIEENIDLMVDWWEEIMARGERPDVNVHTVVSAHIWTNSRQKEQMGKLLYRIARYDDRYWTLGGEFMNENRYADWFVGNYN